MFQARQIAAKHNVLDLDQEDDLRTVPFQGSVNPDQDPDHQLRAKNVAPRRDLVVHLVRRLQHRQQDEMPLDLDQGLDLVQALVQKRISLDLARGHPMEGSGHVLDRRLARRGVAQRGRDPTKKLNDS